MSFWNLFQSEKPVTETENYERLLHSGRITEGKVIDSDGASVTEITQIFYVYSINGADYESSHFLTPDQRTRQVQYAPGASVTVRFDPRQPSNSIVV
jgi:hypothetical protein